jgi:hypothetical protein
MAATANGGHRIGSSSTSSHYNREPRKWQKRRRTDAAFADHRV